MRQTEPEKSSYENSKSELDLEQNRSIASDMRRGDLID